jgi:hypothetical protein
MRSAEQASALRAAIPREVTEAKWAGHRGKVIWALELYEEIASDPSHPEMVRVHAISAWFRLMERIGAI